MGKIIVYAQKELLDEHLLFDCAGKYKVLISNAEKFKTDKNTSIELPMNTDLVSYCREHCISRLRYNETLDSGKIKYDIITTAYPDNYIEFIRDNINNLDFLIMKINPVVVQALNEIGIEPVYVYDSKSPCYSTALSRSYRLKYEYKIDTMKLTSVHLDFIHCKTNEEVAE